MPEKKPGKSPKRAPINYMNYAGMAFQMGILLAIGAFVGKKLDHYFQTSRPYLTALSVVIFLFAAFYLTFKDLLQKRD